MLETQVRTRPRNRGKSNATPQIVEIAESLTPEVLRGVLTAYAVVALEYDGRIRIQAEQRIVMRLIKQA